MIADTPAADATHDDRLDAVLAAYLAARRDGAAPDRGELLARHPDLADGLREFFADQDRFDRAAAPLRAAVGAAASLPAEIGPYEVLGEIARGGMGVVLRARHRELGRAVALKLMLAGPFAGPADRARFRREAEAVALLDHPHIVPIYEVGEHDGLPFFTMKLIEGGSLARRLAGGDRTPPRRLVEVLLAVAQAVHYAHQRGLIHRDLKPTNVLLDDAGAAHVADFGLARRVEGGEALTQPNAIVGTPSYMAPEQAAGKAREVTVASDVYALGAILYEMLTGRPPHRGETPLETVHLVQSTAPAPPRSLAPRLDADLETICLKCLEKEPARRYASAQALADDLARYLAGRPILARPVGAVARAWRWARRQPVIAGLSAALASAVVVGFTAVVMLWQSAVAARAEAEEQRDEARAALAEADRAQRQAEASFRQAHAAVNAFCTTVSDELGRSPAWQPLRQKLLASARGYYAEFLRARAGDPTLRHELADTHFSSALTHSSFGDSKAAHADYVAAVALYRELLAAAPGDLVLQRKLTRTLSNQAIHEDLATALATTAEVVVLYDRFLADRPGDPELAAGRALVLANRGGMLGDNDQLAAGLASLDEALAVQGALARRHPWHLIVRGELAATLHNLGVLYERLGRPSESLCCYLRALDLREELARAEPDDDVRQADVAAMQHHVGLALSSFGDRDLRNQAMQAHDQALSTRRELAKRHPRVARYQRDLAASLTDLGIWHAQNGRRDLALNAHHESREIHERLLDKAPGSASLRAAVAKNWYNIGVNHGALKQRPEEGDAFRRARQIQEELVRQQPGNNALRAELGRTLHNLGINLWVRKQERESKEVLRQAVESTKLLVSRAPDVLAHRRLLHNHYGMLAEIEWRLGDARASVGWVRLREALWPGDGWELYRAAAEYARAAALLGDDAEAMPPRQRQDYQGYLDLSLAALRAAVGAGFAGAAAVEKDADLKPLRGRADFARLLEAMRHKARPR